MNNLAKRLVGLPLLHLCFVNDHIKNLGCYLLIGVNESIYTYHKQRYYAQWVAKRYLLSLAVPRKLHSLSNCILRPLDVPNNTVNDSLAIRIIV